MSFNTLVEEEARLRRMIDGGNDGNTSIFISGNVHNEGHNDNYHDQLLYHISSLTETIISKYEDPYGKIL